MCLSPRRVVRVGNRSRTGLAGTGIVSLAVETELPNTAVLALLARVGRRDAVLVHRAADSW